MKPPLPVCALITVLSCVSLPAIGGVIYADNFDGGGDDLHDAAPDVRPGSETWVASAHFNRNGSTGDGAGSATLPFVPVNGRIYTLEATWSNLSALPGDSDWFGVGFVSGQSAGSTADDRFITGNVVGAAWMLHRGDFNLTNNSAFLGNGQLGSGNNGLGPGGVSNGLAWSLSPAQNAVAMRIVLDTRGGTGNWTATWQARRLADAAYTVVRPTQTLPSPTTITAVGIARSNPGVSGTITNFSLSDDRSGTDVTPPTLAGTSPADDAAGVAVGANFTVTFSETVRAGSGNITLRRSADGSVVETFSVLSSPRLTFSGSTLTIDSSTDLAHGTGYHVQIDAAAIEDSAGNPFAGLAGPASWNFTSAGPGTGDEALPTFVPVTDGNAATDEHGYAGSVINSVAFAQNNLITVGNQQFIAYYRRHAASAGDSANNTVLVARRNLGQRTWEIFPTSLTSYNINDAHNVISMAIDGEGVLHMSWGMHANPLLYARSTTSVLGANPIIMTSLGAAGMTGQENSVTYPKFQTLANGDVLFLFREGGSGSGDWFLNRYRVATRAWAPVHANGSGVQQPLLLGRGASPDNCFYPDRLTLGPDGMLHLAGVFRYNADSPAGEVGYQTNHRYVYLRSPDNGLTWQRSDGSAIALPVVEAAWFQNRGAAHVPEIVEDIPEGSSLINESGMTTDSAGRPIIASWWATGALTGNHARQYHIFFHNGSAWQRRTVSARAIDNPATKYAETQLQDSKMGRPVVLTDASDRIFVIYNDNRFAGITVVFSQPLAKDPGRQHWTRMNLTTENLGNWETTYDEPRWKRDGVLHMLYQQLPGSGASYTAQNNATPVSVLEWNARRYFNDPVRLRIDRDAVPGGIAVSAETRVGFRYDLRTSTGLDFSAPPAASRQGSGSWQQFPAWPLNEPNRFWRVERSEEPTDEL